MWVLGGRVLQLASGGRALGGRVFQLVFGELKREDCWEEGCCSLPWVKGVGRKGVSACLGGKSVGRKGVPACL
jgi:hypothetical protein